MLFESQVFSLHDIWRIFVQIESRSHAGYHISRPLQDYRFTGRSARSDSQYATIFHPEKQAGQSLFGCPDLPDQPGVSVTILCI